MPLDGATLHSVRSIPQYLNGTELIGSDLPINQDSRQNLTAVTSLVKDKTVSNFQSELLLDSTSCSKVEGACSSTQHPQSIYCLVCGDNGLSREHSTPNSEH